MRGADTRGGRRGPHSGLQAQCAGVAPLTAGVADAFITAEAGGAAGTGKGTGWARVREKALCHGAHLLCNKQVHNSLVKDPGLLSSLS